MGFEPHACINILGFNAPEWFFAHFGTILAGGVPAGIYATNLPPACQYISEHSAAQVVVCEGWKQLEKYVDIYKKLPKLKALVMYGPQVLTDDMKKKFGKLPVYTFDAFLQLGQGVADADLTARGAGWNDLRLALSRRRTAQLQGRAPRSVQSAGSRGMAAVDPLAGQ